MPEDSKVSVDLGAGRAKGPVSETISTDPADFFYMGQSVPCQKACPASTNIPAYIRALYEKDYGRSYEINRNANIFPGVLGRVCSRPCEDRCRHGETELGDPVGICHIKRAASDHKGPGHPYLEQLFAPLGQSVAIIGAGPAGLAAAHDLATIGFQVVIYEALDKPGGMLRYGIPEFRLPREILNAEVNQILRLGVEVRYGVRIGRDLSIEDLVETYDAVLAAAGCYTANRLDAPGEDLPGVVPGLDFMMQVTSGQAPPVGERVLVIGAGFTAFDCARSALRLGGREVTICLRRTEQELRVTRDEVLETKLEGVRIEGLMVTRRIIGRDKVEGIEFARSRWGDPSADGRRRVLPIEGSEFTIKADTIIVATGQSQRPIPFGDRKDLRGDPGPGAGPFATSHPKVYVCGDYATGPSTVIESVAGGRQAAEQIARDLTGRRFREPVVRLSNTQTTDRSRIWDFIPRNHIPTVEPVTDRFTEPNVEVELGFSGEAAHEESRRCYLCYLHYEIDVSRCIYCRYCIDVAPRDCIKLVEAVELNEIGAITGYKETNDWKKVNAVMIDNSRCIRCGECLRVCPVDCISVTRVERVERFV